MKSNWLKVGKSTKVLEGITECNTRSKYIIKKH